jgi:O-glycosyl hydrolase
MLKKIVMQKIAAFLLGFATAGLAFAGEHATYNTAGGLTSLISSGVELPVRGEFMLTFNGGLTESMQPHEQRSRTTREGLELRWHGSAAYPNGTQSEFAADWTESESGVALDGSVTAKSPFPGPSAFSFPLDTQSVDYVIDLPRAQFAGGHLEPSGGAISSGKPADPTFFRETVDHLELVDAQGNWRLALALDRARPVTVSDVWDPAAGRFYRVSIQTHAGPWMIGDPLRLGLSLRLTGAPHPAAARLSVDPAATRYPFDGFGGNYRIFQETPIANYSLDNLRVSWARLDFNTFAWDADRHAAHPGPQLRRTFELMQRIQRQGIPWILSLWFLPERFYIDPNQRPFGAFGRQIAPDRWPEFLDLLGSYLMYLKNNYGAEPDLFSFNESDLGVSIGFTADTHRDEIKRIGAYLASLGLKTKMLLGDTANPRDSHKFVLAAAADPEAMRYVGAVSFHSWGNGTPEQYGAWGDVAEWLHLPLLVAEAGVDPGAYQNSAFDSYAYGLREARQFQDLLRYARPQALIYWQFTDDYGLVHVGPKGEIEPTGRFWLMKQFVNLTPTKSEAVATTTDQSDVLISAFVRGDALTVHILNAGPGCDATIAGLPAGAWRTVTTTEDAGYQEGKDLTDGTAKKLHLPARSLISLVRD